MEQTLRDRIRERVYDLLNDWCGQGDDNQYRLKERAVGTAGGSWLFALQTGGRDRYGPGQALATPCRITASASSIVATVSHAISCVRSCGSWSSTVVANIDT